MVEKKKRGRPKKIPLIDQNPTIQLPNEIIQIVEEVKEKQKQEQEQTFEEIKKEVKKAHNGGWDFTKEETPNFFDTNCSYEITGYKPIDKTRGLDFDPSWFTEVRETFLKTGHYCQERQGRLYVNFWKREYDRCKNGMTINGYTITGFNYYFLNYYQLRNLNTTKTGEGRTLIFPDFYVAQYEWFHYLELARVLKKNAVLMKARGVGQRKADNKFRKIGKD